MSTAANENKNEIFEKENALGVPVKTVQFKLERAITLNEQQLSDLLSTASAAYGGFDYWSWSEEEYREAKLQLLAERGETDDDLCYEDIWARLLFNGGHLWLLEAESDAINDSESDDWHLVGLNDICNGLKLYLSDDSFDRALSSVESIIEEGDFWDADAVMQYAAYGEVIYG